VIHPEDRESYEAATAGLDLLPPAPGGATRQDSVRLGLESLRQAAPDAVAIHDAARPFLSHDLIDRLLIKLPSHSGAIAALPVTDTLKKTRESGDVIGTVPRTRLWRAQTPQVFRFHEILDAHEKALTAGADFTDDAAVAENAGLNVTIVEGSPENVKITTPEDMARAERWLAGGLETRVGQGFDVHRLGPGDHVMLCGVRIPHTQGLLGHSDADVALHAITDALLGAIGEGDIGSHFPPSDPKWLGADSALFLSHAVGLLRQRGGGLSNIDTTLICEAPKIAPYRPAMIARVAQIAEVPESQVSVKATTTERLGFAGRGEGIAALSTVTVRLPPGD
jgi:2-C-methyl-D-erythritol 4-phosphate cytidylyltransferase/2-C-methyl-D-erythritol 2,4-cyclodiphosphate synthase